MRGASTGLRAPSQPCALGWCPLPAKENKPPSQRGGRAGGGSQNRRVRRLWPWAGRKDLAEEPGQGVSSEMLCAGLWTDVWLLGSHQGCVSSGFRVQPATLVPGPCLEGAPPLACTQSPCSTGHHLLPRPPDLLSPTHTHEKTTHFLQGKTKPAHSTH